MLRRCASLLLFGSISAFVFAQANSNSSPQAATCHLPIVASAPAGASMFSDQQEEYLGEAIAAQIEARFPKVNDDTAKYLQQLGDRLLEGAPDTKIHFRFTLIDLPENNAFGIGGGRIYVSRKLVAFTRSEDELAGILGHEIGHVLAHQSAIEISQGFRQVLGVNSVGDRKDIFDKWNQFIENVNRSKFKGLEHSDKQEEYEQQVADRIGMYLMTRAGYKPTSYVEAFDRLAGLKGKTGNFLSDLFGTTSADAKRLRELLKNQNASLAAECIAKPIAHDAQFTAWQKQVVENNSQQHQEKLAGVVSTTTLNPPLRSDISLLRFSPDGKYILAQDDANIFVLLRDPLVNLFRIDAPDAHPAKFGGDGKSVSFVTDELRVEVWDLESKKRRFARELNVKDCAQGELSPNGDLLLCVDPDFNVNIYDTATQQAVYTKKNFYTPNSFSEIVQLLVMMFEGGHLNLVHTAFSPDGRYLIVGRNGAGFGYDMQSRSDVKLSGKLKEAASYSVTFVGPDRVAGINPYAPAKSKLLSFPAGQELAELPLGPVNIDAAAKGDYLMVRPLKDYAAGLYDMNQKRIIMGLKTSAMDVFGQDMLAERINGEIGFYAIGNPTPKGHISLPSGVLGGIRARTFSPDLSMVAVSQRSRGGIWKLDTGDRLQHVRGFSGGYFDGSDLVADVPKYDKMERSVMSVHTTQQAVSELYKPEQKQIRQFGDVTIALLPLSGKEGTYVSRNAIFEVRDAKTAKLLWTRTFDKELPEYFHRPDSSRMTLIYFDYDSMKLEAANDPALAAKLAAMKDRKQAYLVQSLEARTGKKLGTFIVDTGNLSFKVEAASSAGDQVLVSDNQNRVLTYDLHTGELKSRAFGRLRAVSESSKIMLVENEDGDCTVYDIPTGAIRAHLNFPAALAVAQFNLAGDALGVVTTDQHAYKIDVGKAIAASSQPEPAVGMAAK